MSETKLRFRIRQNGQTVASTEGPAFAAEAEIMHYAKQYRQDGDITIQYDAGGYWRPFALLCQWPLSALQDQRHEQ